MAASDVADDFFITDESNFDEDHVGTQLRRAREAKGLEIAEIARTLKIRADYLQAIEEADPLGLPPAAYASSFARTYARYLDLDPDEISRGVKTDCRFRDGPKPELLEADTPPERRVPRSLAGALVVLMLAALAFTWYGYHAPANSESQETPPVPAALAEWSFDAAPAAEADDSIWSGLAQDEAESASAADAPADPDSES